MSAAELRAARRSALRAVAAHTSPGTAQHERMPPALRPDWFLVDERSREDWVALLAAQAGQLELVGPDNAPSGRWSALFDHDEALLLARMASARGDALACTDAPDADNTTAPAVAQDVRRLALLLDTWLARLRGCPGPGALALRQLLEAVIEQRLGEELRRVQALSVPATGMAGAVAAPAGTAPQPVAASGSALSPLWAAPPAVDPGPLSAPRWPDASTHESLRSAQALFRATVERLREVAREQLVASQSSGQHESAAALLFAAVTLAGTAQKHANRFTQRLIDFYIDDVLKMRRRPAAPDRLHLLALREAGAVGDPVVPAGTALVAGKDAAGADIVFRTLDESTVGPAQVVALHTLRLVRDRMISPEHELGYVCRARRQDIPADARAGAAGALPVWPLFGGNEVPSPGPAHDAAFGLAVASRQLLLLEGERELRLTLRLGHVATADSRLQALVAEHRKAVHPPAGSAAATPERAHQLLTRLYAAYAQLERRRPAAGLPDAATLARLAAERVAALPVHQRDPLHYYRTFLLLRTLAAQGAGLRFAAGRLFVHWLLSPADADRPAAGGDVGPPAPDWLLDAEADRHALAAVAQAAMRGAPTRAGGPTDGGMSAGDPLNLFLWQPSDPRPSRELIFAQLFSGLFAVSYTGPDGWTIVPEAHLVRPQAQPQRGVDLQVVLRLAASDPPLVGCDPARHGAEWDTALPVLQLRLRSSGGLYPYSMLESAQLLELGLAVSVTGLRQVALHNQFGPLDPSKPFQPFGPLPAQGAYLVLGARELACKPLHGLRLQLRWGGLPTDAAGFAAHYAGWPGAFDNDCFRATPAVLRDGRWVGAAGPDATLFAAEGAAQALDGRSTVSFDESLLRQHHQPLEGGLPDAAPAFDVGAQRALLRLQLSQPAAAFGHAEYASVLTEVVQANARRRRLSPAAPLPRAPYTPLLEGLTLDYASETRIHLAGSGGAASDDGQRLYHVHPLGVACVHPRPQSGVCRLLPEVLHDGTLFIGLRAPQPPGRLSLLFHMHDASAAPGAAPRPRWHALVGDRWQALAPTQVLSDGTAGFLTSGVVVLDLPGDMDATHHLMPSGLYWLAVGVDGGFARVAGLHGVHAQALVAERVMAAGSPPATPLSPGTPVAPATPIPGLAGVLAVGPATGLRPPESATQLRVRTGERLHHRQRAALPWDYERLVLDSFPDVAQVKCFGASALPATGPDPATGQVLVVVVPAAHRFDRASGALYPRMNAAELLAMEHMLQQLCAPAARVKVRNAAYEFLQVRCRVRLAPRATEGAVLRHCEQAVFDHLCPWLPTGLAARFGWAVRAEEIETRLRAVAGVESVTGLSLLHIARDDHQHYRLADTARVPPAAGTVQRVEVRPAVPWSIAVPMEAQLITSTRSQKGQPPQPTGIEKLTIGRNFIIGTAHG